MSLPSRLLVLSFALLFVSSATAIGFGQDRPPIPRPSQKASVIQTVGTTELSITYSRPAVKGRTVYGDWPTDVKGEATLDNQNTRPANAPLVPWGHVWRSGANEATLFEVNDDVLINGQPLAAGKYSLHSIPEKDDWTFIFNKDDGQWGSFSYDASKDALRVKAKPTWVATSEELLTYNIDAPEGETATVTLRWEKLSVPFTVKVKDVVGSTMARLKAFVANAKPDDFGTPLAAAMYAKSNNATADANKWFDQSIKAVDSQLAKKETYQLLTRKSGILRSAGRMNEALAVAEKAITVGKAEGADTSTLEKQVADAKKAMN